ncbi:MAG TPA: ABA4-like family protein [Herpetosiphonaceae bacterium]|nr:ABA4-like family protein [Herpetosiphonaceae bacterium]
MLNQLFSVSSILVMPFWFLMIVLPFWRWTARIVASPWIIAGPAALYAIVLIPILPTVWAGVSNPTLDGIVALLGTPEGAALSWFHFLAFDLFVARWVYLDSRERRISAWFVSPILGLVLMLGPLGWGLYMALRTVVGLVRAPAGPPAPQAARR